jgi:hypothetical protein
MSRSCNDSENRLHSITALPNTFSTIYTAYMSIPKFTGAEPPLFFTTLIISLSTHLHLLFSLLKPTSTLIFSLLFFSPPLSSYQSIPAHSSPHCWVPILRMTSSAKRSYLSRNYSNEPGVQATERRLQPALVIWVGATAVYERVNGLNTKRAPDQTPSLKSYCHRGEMVSTQVRILE